MDLQVIAKVRRKYRALEPELDERERRQWAAAEARELGWGGVTAVAQATGLSRTTITAGLRELSLPPEQCVDEAGRVRRTGGGRRRLTEVDSQLVAALDELIEPAARGVLQSPLQWTCKSTRRLAEELKRQDHPISPRKVAMLLKDAGYSLQANRRTQEGAPKRNAQFDYVNLSVGKFLDRNQPVISVAMKKRGLIGDVKNAGEESRRRSTPEEDRVHDSLARKLGKAIPHSAYDVLHHQSWVRVAIDDDTAMFAVNSIRRWWRSLGRKRFPHARELLITADSGNASSRCRLWEISLQKLADDLELKLFVCHFPQGTSRWNGIQHRLFSFITKNWRGRPLLTHQAAVNLIANTTTETGLIAKAALDTKHYAKVKVTDEQLAGLRLRAHHLHGDWNFTLSPRR